MRARGAPAGFTLLEVLVALAILGLAVVTLIQGFAQGLRLLKLAGDHQRAVLLADLRAREVVTPQEGETTGSDGPFSWDRTVTRVDTPEATTGPVTVRLYRIDVHVRWDERRSVEVATLRSVAVESRPIPPER